MEDYNDDKRNQCKPPGIEPLCFKGGTTVLTENGNTNVESLKIGDIVYTASGSKHIVSAMTTGVSNSNKIFMADGIFPTYCTSSHRFFAKKYLYSTNDRIIYSQPEFFPISMLREGDIIALPVLDISKNKTIISETMAYLLGAFIAAGRIAVNNNMITIKPGYYHARLYCSVLNNSGITFSLYEGDSNTMRYNIYRYDSEMNEIFFNLCMSCGYFTNERRFPKIIFESPENIIRECIRGYGESGGYTYSDKSTRKSDIIKFNSSSVGLLNDVLILLRSIGETPKCYTYLRDIGIRDSYEISYTPYEKNNKKRITVDEKYNVVWSKITTIKNDPEIYRVYCPTVYPVRENDIEEHTIIANGIASNQYTGDAVMLKK